MAERSKWAGPDAEYIVPLYRLAISNVSNEEIANWMSINGLRFSNQMVKRTLKMAYREDLIGYLIKEEEIDLGDTIKSRMTARVGEVVGVRTDGDTIEVKWDTGGRQLLSKESVFKLRTKDINALDDMTKVHTHADDVYKAFESPKILKREDE